MSTYFADCGVRILLNLLIYLYPPTAIILFFWVVLAVMVSPLIPSNFYYVLTTLYML